VGLNKYNSIPELGSMPLDFMNVYFLQNLSVGLYMSLFTMSHFACAAARVVIYCHHDEKCTDLFYFQALHLAIIWFPQKVP
jgi:hypothetical protein